MAEAGDINNDGYADVLIGAPYAERPGRERGAGYLVHGSATPDGGSDLRGACRFRIDGAAATTSGQWWPGG